MRRRAQALRKNATKEENTLWYQYLRYIKPQWRRQAVVEGYILDFYCRRLKLGIELDGSQHFSQDGRAYDAVRTDFLRSMDIQIIRFANSQIADQFPQVCKAIEQAMTACGGG